MRRRQFTGQDVGKPGQLRFDHQRLVPPAKFDLHLFVRRQRQHFLQDRVELLHFLAGKLENPVARFDTRDRSGAVGIDVANGDAGRLRILLFVLVRIFVLIPSHTQGQDAEERMLVGLDLVDQLDLALEPLAAAQGHELDLVAGIETAKLLLQLGRTRDRLAAGLDDLVAGAKAGFVGRRRWPARRRKSPAGRTGRHP